MPSSHSAEVGTSHPSEQPLVSVIMSVFNSSETLREAVESIYAQSYTNWELIVCDDASTDTTLDLLHQLASEGPEDRVVIISNSENMRLAYSLNRCLENASGALVARMDGDDISEPDRLERQVNYLLEHPGVDMVGCAMRRFSASGPAEVIQPASYEPDRDFMRRSGRAAFFHATIVARRSAYDRLGGYTVAWRTQRGQDRDLWYRFFAAGLVGHNLADPLYRVREDAAARRRRTPRVRFAGFLTQIRGAYALGYPPSSYLRAAAGLSKALVPYALIDRHAAHKATKSQRSRGSTR